MTYNLVFYRLPDSPYNQHALIPALYLSDLLSWLKRDCNAEVVRITDDYRASIGGALKVIAPHEWTSYRACVAYVSTVTLLSEQSHVR